MQMKIHLTFPSVISGREIMGNDLRMFFPLDALACEYSFFAAWEPTRQKRLIFVDA
jgi:hypothetical protein